LNSERLNADQVGYRYPGADESALKDVSFSLKRGEIIGLVGLSASGKSTFSRLVKGLIEPVAGRFYLKRDHKPVVQLDSRRRMNIIGWTDSHPERQIFASTVEEETGYGAANQGLKGAELTGRVEWALRSVGFEPVDYVRRDPRRLSGGEKRRLALAGVVAMQTPYYMFDEPTAGLDYTGKRFYLSMIEELKRNGSAVVWITHDIRILKGAVDRVWGMERGSLVLDMEACGLDWRRLARIMESRESLRKTTAS